MRLTRDPKSARIWQVEFRDQHGRLHRWSAFTDKKLSEAWGLRLERLVACKIAGVQPEPDLQEWIATQRPRTLRKLYRLGLTTIYVPEPRGKLQPLVDEFSASMKQRNLRPGYIDSVIVHIEAAIKAMPAKTFDDFTPEAVGEHLRKTRTDEEFSARWSNTRLSALKAWLNWLVKRGRLARNPIASIAPLQESVDRHHDREAFTIDELRRLYLAAKNGETWRGRSGMERYLIYRLAAETGLRRGEIASLLIEDFDLSRPAVTIRAAFSKDKRTDTIHLHRDLAGELKAWLSGKGRKDAAFNLSRESALMLRFDLKAAGIEYNPATAKYLDFHALRHTFCTNVGLSANSPADLQALTRHKSFDLTARYAKPRVPTMKLAIENMPRPNLETPSPKAGRKRKSRPE